MKKMYVMVLLMLFINGLVNSAGAHPISENQQPPMPVENQYCSAVDLNVCASLKFLSEINTETEGEFMVNIKTPQDQSVVDFKADLWMDMGHGHGHGSAPVEVMLTGTNSYHVQNAWFVMPMQWLVRLDFNLNGQVHHIEIPVDVIE